MPTQSARPRYRLELEPLPTVANPTYALRQLLRRALRDHGLRCISVEEWPPVPNESQNVARETVD
jgi:hypothetical protein